MGQPVSFFEEDIYGSTLQSRDARHAPRRARRGGRGDGATAQGRWRHPHRRARGARPRSTSLDQLPHPLLREPRLQPARPLPQRARAEVPDGFLDPSRPRREVDVVEGRHRVHLLAAQGRPLPQQAARERPRGHRGRRQVLARALHGEVRLPRALRARQVHRRRRPLHRAHHAQGAVRAVPQPSRQSELLRDPAARGGGQVQGLQPSGGRDRDRPLRAQVLRQGRPRRVRAESGLLHEGSPVPRRRRDRDHPRRRRAARPAPGRQGRAAPHLGLGEPGRGALAQADQPRSERHSLPCHRSGLHLHAYGPASLQRRARAARGVAGHRPQGVERRAPVRGRMRGRRPRAVRDDGLEARRREDRARAREVPHRLRSRRGQAAAHGGGLSQRLHDADLSLARIRGAVAQLLRAGRRQPRQDRHHRRAEAGGVREIHLDHRARQVREGGHGPVDAVHGGRRLLVRALLSRAVHEPEPRRRRRLGAHARRPAAGDGSQEAQADRRRHPALPRRQGLLRVRAAGAAVRRPPALRQGLPVSRRVRSRHEARVHLARQVKRYFLRRLALAVPTLFLVSVIVFAKKRLMPGDVATRMVEGHAYAPTLAALRHDLGLDRPMHVQYLEWIGGIVTRGDFGRSYWTRQPILEEFDRRFPVTLELALLTILVSVVIGVAVGIVSAVRQDTLSDYVGRVLAILALSVPYFGLAVLVVVLPSIYFKWTPVWTYVPFTTDPISNLKIMIVPALVFGVTRAGPIMRIMRSALLDVLRQDYIRTAWSKGLGERTIVLRHALKNALIPVISLIGLQLPLYIGGSVITEAIFRLPGVGLFFFEALTRLDYPVVQSVNLIIAAMVVGLNLLIDLSYAVLDPRIRY